MSITYVNPVDSGANAVPRAVDLKLSEIPSVIDYGGDPTGAASVLTSVLNAEEHADELLIPTGLYKVDNNLTISCSLNMCSGAIFTVTTGKTLTINGAFSGSLDQHFTGGGRVVFRAGSVTEVYPEWFGADNTGTLDSTAAIQNAANTTVSPARG